MACCTKFDTFDPIFLPHNKLVITFCRSCNVVYCRKSVTSNCTKYVHGYSCVCYRCRAKAIRELQRHKHPMPEGANGARQGGVTARECVDAHSPDP